VFHTDGQRTAMTVRTRHTLSELEQIVLLALRSVKGCEDVTKVIIQRVRPIIGEPSWDVSSIEPVLEDSEACTRALKTIAGLRRKFDLSVTGPHHQRW
jgi:hypothetical protein